MKERYDAVIVGAGPNGLAAAVTIAQAGRQVLLIEGAETVGGGSRSAELTLPRFIHDVCSAIHPLAVSSPYLRSLPLAEHGLEWIQPDAPLAHPLDDGTAAVLQRSPADTAAALGEPAWTDAVGRFAGRWDALVDQFMDPVRVPRRPFTLARFGLRALRSAAGFARGRLRTQQGRALFAGMAAHAFLPLTHPVTAGFGLLLGVTGHAVGWPVPRGGSQAIVDALAGHLRTLGGDIRTGWWIRSVEELPPARAVLLDVTPRQLLAMAGDRLPARYRRSLARFRYGSSVFKVDYALDGPVPWAAPACRRAGTVHLGGSFEEVVAVEAAVARGAVPERPFTLIGQQSLFDPTRAPSGKDTLWAYCHVPSGCDRDMTDAVTAQIERFAPGFTERILATHVMGPKEYEQYNPNYHAGDITGGAYDGLQLIARPALRLVPWRTPVRGLYLCSASTPPGGGVHGACGTLAARAVLRRELR
jgi:phytoene dehydrogenase-like protein